MELVLLQNVEKLGRKGDVLNVKDGFARNFLIPRKLALRATRENRQFVEEQKARAEKRQAAERQEAQERAKQMQDLVLQVEAKVGEGDKLYGSVTSEDVRVALETKGFNVDKRAIALGESIRTLGSHTVVVELYPQVKTNVTVEVVKKS